MITIRNGLGRAAGAIFASAIFLLAATEMAQAQNDTLIVPGVRMGPVHLGITDAELYRLLGDPQSTQVNGDISRNYIFPNFTVSVSASTHKVIQVTTTDPSFATADGVKVGSSGLAVAAKLGAPRDACAEDCSISYPNGVAVGINASGAVRTIWVFAR